MASFPSAESKRWVAVVKQENSANFPPHQSLRGERHGHGVCDASIDCLEAEPFSGLRKMAEEVGQGQPCALSGLRRKFLPAPVVVCPNDSARIREPPISAAAPSRRRTSCRFVNNSNTTPKVYQVVG